VDVKIKYLSRKLSFSCVFSFVNSIYLVLHVYVQTFDVMRVKKKSLVPNRTLVY
jgi:hypothetical protein